ncbi:BTAD domain-containing putative transcriptional regulator [Plantactinospora siamensis]|uniref:BTAD domain-containing putative transcriptional regulator n=1 Tax=Plantactinospora siamensis TaxID=555372 RepID=UPI00406BB341
MAGTLSAAVMSAPVAALILVVRPAVRMPTADGVTHWLRQPLSPPTLVLTAVTVAVLLWVLVTATVVGHCVRLTGRLSHRLPALHVPGPVRTLNAALLGAAAVSATAGAASARPDGTGVASVPDVPHLLPPHIDHAPLYRATAPPVNRQVERTVTVRRGDTLSSIAQRRLGDRDRWPAIYALNRGKHSSTVGGALTNPNLIYPGWVLKLPDDATPPVGAPPRPRRPVGPPAGGPEQPRPGTASPAPTRPNQSAQPPSDAPSANPGRAEPAPDDGADGVASPAPSPTVSVPTNTSASGASQQASSCPAADDGRRTTGPRTDTSPGVSLGTGSWVDAGLVTAILAAVALVWAHRRRRYTPRPPTSRLRLDDPGVEPMPPVVARIRRGWRQPAPAPHAQSDAPLDELVPPPDPEDLGPDGDEPPTSPTGGRQLVIPALASPVIEVWPPAGLGLTGPGAKAAARGFLVSALAAGGPESPNDRSCVVIPSGTLATLLGAAAVTVPDTPRLTVTGGLTDALALLEEQILLRTRLCFDHEVDTITGLRDADFMAEPLPPMVLIADTTAAHERARVAALLTQGQRLDIHGVLLGAWPDGDTVVVDPDGTTTAAGGETHRHGRHLADVGRLTVVKPAEAADLLRVLAESQTGEPQPPAPARRTPKVTIEPHDEAGVSASSEPDSGTALKAAASALRPADTTEAQVNHAPPPPAAADSESGDRSEASAPASPDKHLESGEGDPARSSGDGDEVTGRVTVEVLGDARIVDIDTTQPLRGKSLELLVYLAARGGTASQEAILEDLLPEATASKAPHRLHTYVYNLRRVLKSTGGPATYLSHPDRRYILHRDAVDADLWRMSDAIDEANRASDPADRVAALSRAVAAYQGPLAAGKGYEWIEPYREAVQRQATDATLALAEALADQPAQAIGVLTTALGHHPYAEPLYQAAMRAHAALDDAAAIRDLHRQLARHLDEIDAEVSDETTALARRLVDRVQRARRVGATGKAPT